MRRRVFIAGLGSTAARPLVARAQQSGTPVCGRFTPVTGTQARNSGPGTLRLKAKMGDLMCALAVSKSREDSR
jgi:hypothetical protein